MQMEQAVNAFGGLGLGSVVNGEQGGQKEVRRNKKIICWNDRGLVGGDGHEPRMTPAVLIRNRNFKKCLSLA